MNALKDTQHPAGQVRPTDEELKGQQTLSDYIRSIKRAEAFDAIAAEKRLTFDEWLEDSQVGYNTVETKADLYHYLKQAWNAALKHGKGPSS